MISYLEGKILDKNEKFFVVDVNGVGYKIFSHSGILEKIPENGQNVKIWTHLYVREDAMDLYGFLNKEELEFFEILISISGIGPRSALGILEVAPVSSLKQAIVSEDETFFTKVSGIGRKTAQRLILELKSKLAKTVVLEKGGSFKEMSDAFEALVALGYRQSDVRRVLNELPKDMKSAEAKVNEALKRLGRR
ncbi:MAG: Holliday junction branch migration protein RuvA [Candidatus Azambacteria bacterium]|nr:Holliday junction branch migration protein RuvA [Candidatus Azambacteria bacterium]